MTDELIARLEEGETLDRHPPEAFAPVREASRRAQWDAPLRCAIDRRHGAARGQDRRDEDGRGQDAHRDAAAVPQRTDGRRARISSPSTIISPSSTRAGWGRSITSSASPSASSSTTAPFSTTPSTRSKTRATTTCVPCRAPEAYAADITYGTNNEFGFDYLRDNMVFDAGADGAAPARLRDRGRGGQHPH